MRPRHDARLVPAAFVAYLSAALVASELLSGKALAWAVAASCVLTALSIAARALRLLDTSRGRASSAHAILACAATGAVLMTAATHLDGRWDGGFSEAVASPAPSVELRGTVDREPIELVKPGFDGESRFLLDLAVDEWRIAEGAVGDGSRAHWRRASVTVVIAGDRDIGNAGYGDQLTVSASLTATTGERAVAVGWDATVLDSQPPSGHHAAVAAMRADFTSATAGLPPFVQGLTRGMVIGDTRTMTPIQRQEMQVTGLTHLTAVSGAHFAIVAVTLHSILRRIRAPRALRAVVAGAGLAGFTALVMPDPSVLRALVMALVGAIAVAWGRPPQALAALNVAVVVLLLIDPFLALEAGFVLSVSAVAAIVLWAPRLRIILERFMPPLLAMLISVPMAAQAVCAPLLILLEPQVSVYAVLANLLAAPAAAPVTLMGLVAVLAGPVAPVIAEAFSWLASVAVWPVAWTAQTLAGWPGAQFAWPPGAVGAAILAFATAVVMWWTVPRGRWQLKMLASAIALVGVVVSAHSSRTWDWAAPPPGSWAVVACDVGQGDMMILRGDSDSAVVIDTGPGDGTASACLHRYGITTVSLLILTHPHADHDGGVQELLDSAQVTQAWLPSIGLSPENDQAARILDDASVEVSSPGPGTTWDEDGVTVTLQQAMAVAEEGYGRDLPVEDGTGVEGTELNDASLVVSAQAQGVSVLALGDLEMEAQEALAEAMPPELAVDVVKVPHHGSRVQDPGLVQQLSPQIAVFSVGASNTYGHPSPLTLDLYGASGALVLRTDLCSDIVVWRDPQLRQASDCQPSMAG